MLEVPEYIDPELIHALPDPAVGGYLGSVVAWRRVPRTDHPEPGHCWYVVQDVPRLGHRLRLWDQSGWLEPEEMTEADWVARVAWWNAGVAAGWAYHSELNDRFTVRELLHGAPATVLDRLRPTPALVAWRTARGEAGAAGPAPEEGRSTPREESEGPPSLQSAEAPSANDTAAIAPPLAPAAERAKALLDRAIRDETQDRPDDALEGYLALM